MTDTAGRILDAALDELADQGVRRFAVEDVARRAGVNRITIYRHFAGREELLRAVILREGRRLFESVDAAVAGLDTPEERVVEGFVAGLRGVRDHPLVQHVLRREPEVLGALAVEHGAAVVEAGSTYLLGHVRREWHTAATQVQVELAVRLCLSFVLVPTSRVSLDTDARARAFARKHLAPAVAATRPRRARAVAG